ncbi:MAG: hypothetical protein L6Q33_12735, partial [Bacteriovoracaceae bacterium]|nr:hypothetical protein [Bacteriovoracaceae bacterium]
MTPLIDIMLVLLIIFM